MSLNVNSVNSTPTPVTTQQKNTRTADTSNDTTSTAAASDDTAVVYEPSTTSSEYEFSIPEDRGLIEYKNTEEIDKLFAENKQKEDQMTSLINKMMSKQTDTYFKAFSFDDYSSVQAFKKGVEDGSIEVDEETRLQAQKDIAEDGYYGVQQTSDRILDFAKAIAGDDPNKIATMRDSVQKGFDQAAQMWGGSMDKMPQITRDTYDAVMKGFDEWEANSEPSKIK